MMIKKLFFDNPYSKKKGSRSLLVLLLCGLLGVSLCMEHQKSQWDPITSIQSSGVQLENISKQFVLNPSVSTLKYVAKKGLGQLLNELIEKQSSSITDDPQTFPQTIHRLNAYLSNSQFCSRDGNFKIGRNQFWVYDKKNHEYALLNDIPSNDFNALFDGALEYTCRHNQYVKQLIQYTSKQFVGTYGSKSLKKQRKFENLLNTLPESIVRRIRQSCTWSDKSYGIVAQEFPITFDCGVGAFTCHKNRITIGLNNGTIKSYNLAHQEEPLIMQENDENDMPQALAHHNNLLACLFGNKIIVWDLNTRPPLEKVRSNHAEYGYDGKRIAISAYGNKVIFVDAENLARIYDDNKIRVWNLMDDSWKILQGHTDTVVDLVALPNSMVASSSDDGTIKIWNKFGKAINTITNKLPRQSCFTKRSLIRINNYLVSSCAGVNVWNLQGKWKRRLLDKDRSLYMLVSVDPSLLAGFTCSRMLIWNIETGECLKNIEVPYGYFYQAYCAVIDTEQFPATYKIIVKPSMGPLKVLVLPTFTGLLNRLKEKTISQEHQLKDK